MFYPDHQRLIHEFTHNARETYSPGYMLDISTNRAAALLDSAYLYVTGNGHGKYAVPNGKFSDAECILWELFTKAIRAGIELSEKEEGR